MFLFIDLKAKGFPRNIHKPILNYDLFDVSISEIAWLLVDAKMKIVEKGHFKLLNEGYVNCQDSEKLSNSSNFETDEEFSFSYLVKNLLKGSLDKAKLIIYYDINLKDNLIDVTHVLESAEHENPFLLKDRLCILEETIDLFSHENGNATHTLSRLYSQLFKEDLPDILSLDVSVNALSRCFFELKKDKYLNLSGRRNYHTESILLNKMLPSNIKSIKGTVRKVAQSNLNQEKNSVRNTYKINSYIKEKYTVIEQKNYNSTGKLTAWEEKYYVSNIIRYSNLYSSKKGILSTVQYNYDNFERLESINYYNGEMRPIGTKYFTYDDDGFLTNIFFKKMDCTLVETNIRHNGLGNLYVESCHISDENLDKETIKVDSLGNVIESFRYKYINTPKGVTLFNKFRYSGNNLILERDFTKMVGENFNIVKEHKLKYEYEFDKWNNWIRKTEYADGVVQYIEIREIEYSDSNINLN